MKRNKQNKGARVALALALIGSGLVVAQVGGAVAGQRIANNTPGFVATAQNLGALNPSQVIDVSVWLNPHNKATLDTLAQELYTASSPQYRAWLQPADILARFAPTAAEAQTVSRFLSSQGLTVVAVGPQNFFVHAQGPIATVEKAFGVTIDNFSVNGKTYYANTGDPSISGPAGALAAAVYGLTNETFEHPLLQKAAVKPPGTTGNETATVTATNAFFTSNCFGGVKTENYTTNGSYPTATYKGNSYNKTDNPAGCGYTPADIQTAYNLKGLYSEGYNGNGQTIVIIDWCGSPTIESDANAFSARFGLPPLTSSNFRILYSSTTPTCGGPDPEINIDVEWAHAVAPGANIDLVVPPSPSFMDVDDAELYALANGLGNVISGSYGSEEMFTPPAILNEENLINEIAAVMGISADFATGDAGDYTFDFPLFNPASVIAPADSPYATAVGGVSLALKSDNSIAWQAGWGNNETILIDSGTIFNPPLNLGFYAGSGGGPSAVFAKPLFQAGLPGTQRLLPDIAWLADPFTGAIIAITENFVYPPLEWTVYGGTSVATPMFSALWAIANEEAGQPLGQAARYVYSMPAGTISDVVPVGSATNVTATITDSPGSPMTYTAAEVAAPLDGTTIFFDALWDIPLLQDTTYVVTFGTDSGLMTAPGWDDVTGMGVPNAKAFADYFKTHP